MSLRLLELAAYASMAICAALAAGAWALAALGWSTRDPARVAKLKRWSWKLPILILVLGVSTGLVGLALPFVLLDNVPADQKAAVLAVSISEAINCTAVALVLSIAATIPFPLLIRREQALRRPRA